MDLERLRKLRSSYQQRTEENYSRQTHRVLERTRDNARIGRNLATGLTILGATIGFGASVLNTESGQFTTAYIDTGLIFVLGLANQRADDVFQKRIIAINRVLERRRQQVMRSVGITPLQQI